MRKGNRRRSAFLNSLIPQFLNFPAMSLASGTQLGPYEIVAAIGAGGMGEGSLAGTCGLLPGSHIDTCKRDCGS